MAKEAEVYIAGLKELRAQLKRVDADLPKQMQRENKAFAQRVVPKVQSAYTAAYPKANSKSRPNRRRKNTVNAIRAVATQTSSGVRIGGARYPHMVGQEFGSYKFKQFAPWTGPGPGGRGSRGRFLYPTVRGEVPRVIQRYRSEVMDPLFARAFPNRGAR